MLYQPRRLLRLTSWSGQDKRLSIPTNIRVFRGDKDGRMSVKPRPMRDKDSVLFGHDFCCAVTIQ
jgi:hypothetical protein